MHHLKTLIDDGNTKVRKYSLDEQVVEDLYEYLEKHCEWIYAEQKVYNKVCAVPRGMCFYGDAEVKKYRYSKLTFDVLSWDTDQGPGQRLRELRDLIQEHTKELFPTPVRFDSCLLNYYRTGSDYIAYHKDREALGDYNCVVTISLGTCRRFLLQNSEKKKVETTLSEGDVIVMSAQTETDWQHSIPKVAISRCPVGRISLTFRQIN